MAGIMDMFRNAAATVTGNPAPQPPNPATMPQPGNIPPNAVDMTASVSSAGTAPNGAVPASTAADAAAKSPLDAFSDLWKTDPNAKPAADAPYFNVDMAALSAAASKQDFTSTITPEHLKAIAAGGEDAVKAFASAMNSVAQDIYAKSAFATTKIVEAGLNKSENKLTSSLVPGLIKQHAVSNSLREENPAFSHPAAQPLISSLEAQLTTKFPDATAAELRKMATDYLGSFASMFAAPPSTEATAAANKTKANEVDWSTFL